MKDDVNTKETQFLDLPDELLNEIALRVDKSALLTFALLCKRTGTNLNQNIFWKIRFNKDFGELIPNEPGTADKIDQMVDYKLLYSIVYRLLEQKHPKYNYKNLNICYLIEKFQLFQKRVWMQYVIDVALKGINDDVFFYERYGDKDFQRRRKNFIINIFPKYFPRKMVDGGEILDLEKKEVIHGLVKIGAIMQYVEDLHDLITSNNMSHSAIDNHDREVLQQIDNFIWEILDGKLISRKEKAQLVYWLLKIYERINVDISYVEKFVDGISYYFQTHENFLDENNKEFPLYYWFGKLRLKLDQGKNWQSVDEIFAKDTNEEIIFSRKTPLSESGLAWLTEKDWREKFRSKLKAEIDAGDSLLILRLPEVYASDGFLKKAIIQYYFEILESKDLNLLRILVYAVNELNGETIKNKLAPFKDGLVSPENPAKRWRINKEKLEERKKLVSGLLKKFAADSFDKTHLYLPLSEAMLKTILGEEETYRPFIDCFYELLSDHSFFDNHLSFNDLFQWMLGRDAFVDKQTFRPARVLARIGYFILCCSYRSTREKALPRWEAGIWFLEQAYPSENNVALLIAKAYLTRFDFNLNGEKGSQSFIKKLFRWALSALLLNSPWQTFISGLQGSTDTIKWFTDIIKNEIVADLYGSRILTRLNNLLKDQCIDKGIICAVRGVLNLTKPFNRNRITPDSVGESRLEPYFEDIKHFESAKEFLNYLKETSDLPNFVLKKLEKEIVEQEEKIVKQQQLEQEFLTFTEEGLLGPEVDPETFLKESEFKNT